MALSQSLFGFRVCVFASYANSRIRIVRLFFFFIFGGVRLSACKFLFIFTPSIFSFASIFSTCKKIKILYLLHITKIIDPQNGPFFNHTLKYQFKKGNLLKKTYKEQCLYYNKPYRPPLYEKRHQK